MLIISNHNLDFPYIHSNHNHSHTMPSITSTVTPKAPPTCDTHNITRQTTVHDITAQLALDSSWYASITPGYSLR